MSTTVLQLEVGWYRLLRTTDELPKGTLVYAYRVDEDNIRYVSGDNTYYLDRRKFTKRFRYEPDGETLREHQIKETEQELHRLAEQQVDTTKQLTSFTPHVDAAGEFSTGTALAGKQMNPLVAKKQLADIRNQVTKQKLAIVKQQQKLAMCLKEKSAIARAKLEEQKALIDAKVGELQSYISKAEKAIWTVNLYLGHDEHIAKLATGHPAPPETPITIRQLVLHMDEECAIGADVGGIDATQIRAFDQWLLTPLNLKQVFPEPKGVVALKPRRHAKHYGDLATDMDMAEANAATYFLIRNGENLYRLCTDFDIGKTLIPTVAEFNELFEGKDGQPLKPGSEEYMAAMDRADEVHKHYMRVVLILQGLLDRTKIFHPLPVPHINLLNPQAHEEHLRCVYDAESDKLLGSTRPPFDDWLRDANRSLGVGQRVIGYFNYRYGDTGYGGDPDSRQKRLTPSSAELPESEQLHTIEKLAEDKRGFYFYYGRKEQIYVRYEGYHDSRVRARCKIYPDDKHLLNFDADDVTIGNIQYYINSRLNRHCYADMLPILTRALALKQQEAKEEEPFCELLKGQIMKAHQVSHEAAEEMVPTLVRWWKFKNQTHRALLSDDMKAIKMIVHEFGIRRRRAVERTEITDDDLTKQLVETILEQEPQTILIGHVRENEYCALVAHEGKPVYVKEQIWATNRSSSCPVGNRVRQKSNKEWRRVDTRHERWQILFQSPRWQDWIKDSRAITYLTGPERQQFLVDGLQRVRELIKWEDEDWGGDKGGVLPLAATVTHDTSDELRLWFCTGRLALPEQVLTEDEDFREPRIECYEFGWKRTAHGTKFQYDVRHHYLIQLDDPPWREGRKAHYHWDAVHEVLQVWDKNIKLVKAEQKAYAKFMEYSGDLSSVANDAIDSVSNQLKQAAVDAAYQAYLVEFGDPELWEEHKKSVNITWGRIAGLDEAVDLLLEREIGINGLTVGEVLEKAKPFVPKKEITDEDEEDSLRSRRGRRHYRHRLSGEEKPSGPTAEQLKLVVTHGELPRKLI